ncbi:hypothetical protein [Methylobacter sp. BBA5.1]|jgi:hypothetical protein|uniref:hypothetical protein n=2 Tax=Methylococcaceae TaxID=403 RepID=UPI00036D7C24|nr:hypothetical protein [Methylobacter sp. BBA5.1]
MIHAAFNIGILTLIFFIVGMIKPQWPLFFMKKPDRFWVLIISTILFMVAATLFGEGNRRAELEQPSKYSQPQDAVPVPETAPAKPAQ